MLKTLKWHSAAVWSVAFNPNPDESHILASGGGDNTTVIWDTTTGQPIKLHKAHSDLVSSVAFSPGRPNLLASGSRDETIIVWDVASNNFQKALKGQSKSWLASGINNVVFHPTIKVHPTEPRDFYVSQRSCILPNCL